MENITCDLVYELNKDACKLLRRRGFTLIELLVVVSIIVILMSMLLPAIGKAKGKAQEIACLNNLKQSGMGILQYATDHNGWTPCHYRPWGGMQWGRWLISLSYLSGGDPDALLGKSSEIVCPSSYPNGKYLHVNYTYGFRVQAGNATFFQVFKGRVSCMAYFSATEKYTSYTYPSWDSPSNVNILADTMKGGLGSDANSQWYYYQWSTSATSQTIQTRHSKAANSWFADGHADRISQTYLLQSNVKFFDANGTLF